MNNIDCFAFQAFIWRREEEWAKLLSYFLLLLIELQICLTQKDCCFKQQNSLGSFTILIKCSSFFLLVKSAYLFIPHTLSLFSQVNHISHWRQLNTHLSKSPLDKHLRLA